MSAWRKIAKNEIRLWTTRFRRHRRLFFYLITLIIVSINIFLLAINFLFIGLAHDSQIFEKLFISFIIIPQLSLSPIQIQQLQALFLYQNVFSTLIIQLIPPLIEMFCLYGFLFALTYPIQTSLQELNISHIEIVLSSPVTGKDMLLGNFLGRLPIYIMGDLILVPIVWTLISIFIPLSIVSYFSFIIIFLVLFIVGTLLGTVTSSYLSLKLGQSEKGIEKAKGYVFLMGAAIGIPMVMIFMFRYVFLDPNVQFILKFLPTTWFGDIINFTIIPNFLPLPMLMLFIGLASLFSIGIFYLSYLYGDRVYSLELGTQDATTIIIHENSFFKFLKRIFGSLSVVQAKQFFRYRENIMRLIYGMLFAILVPISTLLMTDQNYELMDILTGNVIPEQFPMMMTGWMLAIMMGPMLGSLILVRSKDIVWVYKKSPRGVSSLVYSFLKVVYFILFLIIFPLCVFLSLLLGYDYLNSIFFIIITNLWVFSALAISIAIQCWRPAFKERSPKMAVNILISMSIFSSMLILMSFFIFFLFIYALFIISILLLLISLGLLQFGIRKLNALE